MKRVLLCILVCMIMLCSVACQKPEDIVVGEWEKYASIGVIDIEVDAAIIRYTFYEDGTCVQSTDLGQTSTWSMVDDTHVKVVSPLNFTDVLELRQADDGWYLGDYKKVESD